MIARLFGFAVVVSSLSLACSGATSGAKDETRGPNDTGSIDDAGADSAEDSAEDIGIEDSAPSEVAPDAPLPECSLRPKCDAPLPDLGAKRDWNHTSTKLTVGAPGGARHRGRDQVYKPGQTQWAIGKFSYSANDDDIKDEDVDVYLLRDCGTTWTKVGTYKTSNDGQYPTVEGVEDTGGRVYVELSKILAQPLGVGRHRVRFVVGGDLTGADQFIEVLPEGARYVVSDIDGTLTSSERASWTEAFGGAPPGAHPGSAEAITTLAKRGFYVFYLTARPEWFVQKTRDWLDDKGFPAGLLHTTFSNIGETGAAAHAFKSGELAMLKTKTGIVPTYGFGNTDTDVSAYEAGNIQPAANRYFFELMGDLKGGTSHADYAALVPTFAALTPFCP